MLPSKPFPRPATAGSLLGLGCGIGLLAYGVSSLTAMGSVPRRAEGSRHVVDLSWSIYALLPGLFAFLLLAVIGRMVPRQKWRLLFFMGFCLAIAGCNLIGAGLLRRDFIGKF